MRQVILDDVRFQIKGEITERQQNPWKASLDVSGVTGYSSFSKASVTRWQGLRGGIGRKYQKGTGTEELWFSEGLDTSLDGGIILGPKVNTAGTFGAAAIKIIDFRGVTYAIGDSVCKKWNTETSAWDTADASALASPLDAIVVTDETSTYLVVSNFNSARYSTDGITWNALADCKGFLAVFDNRLIGFYGQMVNKSPRGDIDGSWGSFKVSMYLGAVHGIYSGKLLTSDEPALFLHCSEGWFVIDFWHRCIYPLDNYSGYTYSGKAGIYWNSYHWVATGEGIKKYSPGMSQDVGVDQNDGLPLGYQGAVYDMLGTANETWLIYCVNGGSSDRSSIFKRHGTIGGNQQIYTTSAINKPIRCLCHSPSSMYPNGRLWWGEDTDIKYCMSPDFNADPTEISGYEFVASAGKCILSIFRPLAAFNKLALRIMAVTKGCDANKKFTIYYQFDESGSWTNLGEFASSPTPAALQFASGAGLEFRTIKISIEAITDNSTATPELKSLSLAYLPLTDVVLGWTFVVSAKGADAEEYFTNLKAIRDKKVLVQFYPSGDKTKTAYWGKITNLPSLIHWDMNRQEGQISCAFEEIFSG